MVIDAIVVGGILLVALHGYWKGFLRKLAGLLALAAACVGTWFLAPHAAEFASEQWDMDPVAVYIPCCVVGWLVLYILLRIILGRIAKKMGSTQEGKPKPWNRNVGALFGGLEGLAIAWLVVGFLDCIPEDWRAEHMPALHEQMQRSPFFVDLAHATNPGAFLELKPLMDDIAAIAKHPEVLESLQEDPAIQELMENEKVKAVMEDEGLLAEIGQRPGRFLSDRKVRDALDDPEVREILRRTSLRDVLHQAAERARTIEEEGDGDDDAEGAEQPADGGKAKDAEPRPASRDDLPR